MLSACTNLVSWVMKVIYPEDLAIIMYVYFNWVKIEMKSLK